MKKFLRIYWLESIILFFSFIIKITGINYGLPYSYHTEEYKIVNYALKFGTGDFNPRFFEYPSLYLYFIFFIYGIIFVIGKVLDFYKSVSDFALLYFRNPTIFYLSGRIISSIFGTLSVLILYFIVKKIYDRKTAIISMLLFSVVPSVVVSCKIVRIEMALIFTSLVFFWFLLKTFYDREDKDSNYYICAILVGIGTSLKYIPAIFLPLIFYVHFLKRKKLINKTTIICCLLFILSFILGTPYSVFDFRTFIQDIKGLSVSSYGRQISYIKNFFTVMSHYLYIGNEKTSLFPFLGLIGWGVFVIMLYEFIKFKQYVNFLLLYPILANAILVIRHYFPGKGFLFVSFPYFIILTSYGLSKILERNKLFFVIIFMLSFMPSLVESIFYNIYYSQKDTRTLALEWIEKNIPPGEKILIDRYPNSPPLKMTKQQLEKLYKKAVELNHYKKEYFYWQLKAHPGEGYGYEVYEVYHPPHEIGTIKHQVEEAQKVREIIDVSYGIEYVKQLGIKYIILNSFSETEFTKKFYQEVKQKCLLFKKFKPKTELYPGPIIWIYRT